MHPRARTAHLVVQELPTETLVFDQREQGPLPEPHDGHDLAEL